MSGSRVSVRLCIAAIISWVISLGWSYLTQYLKRNDLIGSVLSRDRVKTERHNGFHLFERMLVATVSLVGRKERM